MTALFTLPKQVPVDSSGTPYGGAKLHFYRAGTTTYQDVYTTSALSVAHDRPVVADADGVFPAIYLNHAADYDYRVMMYTSADVLLHDQDNYPKNGVTGVTVLSTAVKYDITAAETAAGVTPTDFQYDSLLRPVVRYEDIANDNSTDNTADILTACNAIGGFFIIPPNVRFVPKTLLTSLDTDVVFLDLSMVNDFRSAGETTKAIGILSSDEAVSDTHWYIGSGHHSIFTLNNFGTAGSTSGDERKASVLWAAGKFELGASDKRGFRGAAIHQYTKDSSGSYWIYQLRSLAPWNAISGEYEEWAAGQTIVGTGVYRWNGSSHYVSATSGTNVTGATPPTHTSGTVSDGTVDWTWVDSIDRSVYLVDQYGRWLIGNGAISATWRHKVSPTDPSGAYAFEGESTGTSAIATLKLIPTDSGGSASSQPYLQAQDGVGLRVMNAAGSTDLARFSEDGTSLKQVQLLSSTAADADATPTVAGIGTLYVTNTGATSITALDDGTDDQIVNVIATNGNTTLVHSSTLMLTGSANQALTAYSSVTFQKVPTAISDRWIEIARSVK